MSGESPSTQLTLLMNITQGLISISVALEATSGFPLNIKDRIQKNAFNFSLIRLIFMLLGQTRNPGQQTQSVPIKLSAGYHTSFRETGKCQN